MSVNIPVDGVVALINYLNNGSLGVTNSNGILTGLPDNSEPLGLIFADNNCIVHLAYYNAEGLLVPVKSSAWGKSAVVIPHVIFYIGTDNPNTPDLSSDGAEEKNLVGAALYPTLQMTGDMDGHYGLKIWVKSIADNQEHTLQDQYGLIIKAGTKDENTTIEKATALLIEKQTAGIQNVGIENEGRTILWEGVEFVEQCNPPVPSEGRATLFCRDNGKGKTQLAVRFVTGEIQILATQD